MIKKLLVSLFVFSAVCLFAAGENPEIQSLIEKLGSTNPAEANSAASSLSQLGKPALKALVEALKAPFPTPKWASWALGMMKDEEALDGLAGALKSENEKIRSFAISAIGEIKGKKAEEILINYSSDEKSLNREDAVFALAKIKDKECVKNFRAWLKDSNPKVRGEAAKAIGRLGDTESVNTLVEMIKTESDQDVRVRIIATLSSFSDPKALTAIRGYLQEKDENVKINSICALEILKDHEALEALKKLAESDPSESVKKAAEKAIKSIDSPSQK
ncbi:MAG: HEAT repeat domain-containing protein [Candidatus Riflebacteria bacterium]|nr:HEAT repeat domain-containing protein [Candidatus Riflebacteria bacterium]